MDYERIEEEFDFSYETTAQNANITEFVWDKDVPETDKWDYTVATTSGLITAALDCLCHKTIKLEDAHTWGVEKVASFVKTVAKLDGYTGDDDKDAIAYLEKNYESPSDKAMGEFGGTKQHHLRDFSHHASLSGLGFSLLTQFTNKAYGTDTDGSFKTVDLAQDVGIGKSITEKVYNGVVVWAMHIVSDMAGSSTATGEGTGVPGMVLSSLKVLSVMPIFKEMSIKYKDDKIAFSTFISKMFNGTFYRDENGNAVPFDLRTEIGLAHKVKSRNMLPLLLNECIVRVFYAIRRFAMEVEQKEIRALEDLQKVNWDRVLPFNNRTITRMTTISSGVFTNVTTAKAAVVGLKNSGGNWVAGLVHFAVNINYPGLFRFATAVCADKEYIADDVEYLCQAFRNRYNLKTPKQLVRLDNLCLTDEQSRFLYSLKLQEILYDIEKTKKAEHKEEKTKWMESWKEKILTAIKSDETYFLNADVLYEELKGYSVSQEWYQLVLMETLFYVPFYPLNGEKESKIKQCSNFEQDILCEKYALFNKEWIEKVKKAYRKHVQTLDERVKKKWITVIATSALFAPGLVMPDLILLSSLAFEASAYVETALGGGQVFSLLGAGVAPFTSKGIILNECAKLLTYCECCVDEEKKDEIKGVIKEKLSKNIADAQESVEKLSLYKNRENGEIIKNYNRSIKYMQQSLDIIENL